MSPEPGPRRLLEACLHEALAAVHAGRAVESHWAGPEGAATLPPAEPPQSRADVVVLAAGKAASAMAAAAEARLGDRIRSGLVVTKDGHGLPLARLEQREAAHPVPDARGARAAAELRERAAACGPDDHLLVLLSGGASALLTCPLPGLSLADLVATTELLLACGADIHELNAVRKHLSALAGGRLACASPAGRIAVLAVSDVPGDRPDVIASGPCTGDPTRFADALAVFERHGVAERVPAAVRAFLEQGVGGAQPESPAPDDPRLARVAYRIVADNARARAAVCTAAAARGVAAVDLGEVLDGEARRAAVHLLAEAARRRSDRPVLLVAGGETTVTLRGDGRGGRSQELALAAALELAGRDGIALLAAGTDGSDGPTDAAGAHADGGSVARGAAQGVDAAACLARNDAYGFFLSEGGLVRTGPTHTNVMDLCLIWLEADPRAGT